MARHFLTTGMDESSPGQRTDGPVRHTENRASRMDSLLATLQKDIKVLCQEGELMSAKMWQLYHTFEDVVHENPFSQTSKIPDEVVEDGDSGVAMTTIDTREESLQSSHSLFGNRLGENKTNGINKPEKFNDNHVRERAWYETEDDENDGVETEGEEIMIRRCVRNGLTEEWVRYGHFQLTGKHDALTDEKGQPRRENAGETIQYDWESFTEEDDNVTLTYEWSSDDNDLSPVNEPVIERYRIEDQKVIPHTSHTHVTTKYRDTSTKEPERQHHHKTYVPTPYQYPNPSRCLNSCQPQTQQATHSVDPLILKRRKLYRKISSSIVDALSRQDVKQRKHAMTSATELSEKVGDPICTCPHPENVANVRATTAAEQQKRQDKNNNNNNPHHHHHYHHYHHHKNRNTRIITNGSLEQLTKARRSPVLRDNFVAGRVKVQTNPTSGERLPAKNVVHTARNVQSKLPKIVSEFEIKPNNVKKIEHAEIEYFTEDCSGRQFPTQIPGDRRPIIFYDIDKEFDEDSSYSCTVNKDSEQTITGNDRNRGFGLRHKTAGRCESRSSDNLLHTTITPETNLASNTHNKRLTWDLGDRSLPDDPGLDQVYSPHVHRTPYQGNGFVGPSKKLFTDSASKSVSNLSHSVLPETRPLSMWDNESERSFSSRESLRLCGIRYAGFQAAWPSINTVGNRRSFSGFTVMTNPRDKINCDRLQPTYC